ncbi:helix-turn-helix transcriptional regulator [soil metagenome]
MEESVDESVYVTEVIRNRNLYKYVYLKRDAVGCVRFLHVRSTTVSRESAGAAIRALRESRDWSLAELAGATGVSIMGLSYLERGTRKPHKGTVQKVENGLGLPPGTYSRLLVSPDPDTEISQLLMTAEPPRRAPTTVVVERNSNTAVLAEHAKAHIESLNSAIARLPPHTSNEYETYILSVITQCVKAEMLAANSWRVAVNAGADPNVPLLGHVKTLESTRAALLARLQDSIGARFDRACAQSSLPEAVIAALVGITTEEMWDIRNSGLVPPGALSRIRAFVDAAGTVPDQD